MTKIALVLAIVAIGEGAVTLHLVNQLHEERDSAQKLQARVTELESKAPPVASGATFVAVPTQPTITTVPFRPLRSSTPGISPYSQGSRYEKSRRPTPLRGGGTGLRNDRERRARLVL